MSAAPAVELREVSNVAAGMVALWLVTLASLAAWRDPVSEI